VAERPLVCPAGGAEDPSLVVDAGAAPGQLVFRQEGARAGVYVQALAPDGRSVGGGGPGRLLADGPAGERASRPSLAVVAPDRAVLLFTSTTVGGARSIGWMSCAVASGRVTGCGPAPGARQWIVGDEHVADPGAPQVFGDDTGRWLAYDARPAGSCATGTCTGPRRMHVDKLCVDDRGAPRTPAPSTGRRPMARQPACRADVPDGWLATWATGLMRATPQFRPYDRGFDHQTLRQVVHTSIGGSAVRVRLSNADGTVPLHVGHATVGLPPGAAGTTARVVPATLRPLTFGGRAEVVVPPGGDVVSDALTLDVPQDHDLAVSLWFPGPTGPPTGHLTALETSYVGSGDRAADAGPGFAGAPTTTASFFVGAVDVLARRPLGTVALLGDSLTDGVGALDPDGEHRWSDLVADRLDAFGPLRLGLVNVGIAGDTLLPDVGSGLPAGLDRLQRDVLAQTDVDTVVVLLGTNDLLGSHATGPALVDGLRRLIEQAHAARVRVVGATIPPLAGPADPPAPVPAEQARAEVNAHVRPGAPGALAFDAVVDVDAALRDPADPTRVRARFAWFGGFHPNAAGHRAIADQVDLSVLHADPQDTP
jgi:lysophospholipase L1-like esterase